MAKWLPAAAMVPESEKLEFGVHYSWADPLPQTVADSVVPVPLTSATPARQRDFCNLIKFGWVGLNIHATGLLRVLDNRHLCHGLLRHSTADGRSSVLSERLGGR